MRILLYESITGGGRAGAPLPASLAREGALMLEALLGDLHECPGLSALAARDARLAPLPGAVRTLYPRPGEDAQAHFLRCCAQADAAIVVAPETGGELARRVRAACASGHAVLGCALGAIELATSKSATARHLAGAGIPVVPTWIDAEALPERLDGVWAVKPDDGCGGLGLRCCAGAAQARAALRPGEIAQPWLDGEPASLTLLCAHGQAQLLSVNRQHLDRSAGEVRLQGIEVAAHAPTPALRRLAQDIAAALPGLWGWVGVDVVLEDGQATVLEINPRPTTSCCALRAACGANLVHALLELHAGRPPQDAVRPTAARRTVRIDLEDRAHA